MYGSFTIKGPAETVEYTLTRDRAELGRGADKDVPLAFPTVSAHHATLIGAAGGCRIVDRGSVNGTSVNGVRIPAGVERVLHDGDLIEIGPFRLEYHAPRPAGPHAVRLRATLDVGSRPGDTIVLPADLPPRLVVSTPEWSRQFVLGKTQLTLGRGGDNDVVVPVDAVSRHHARLELRGSDLLVTDLGSTNGLNVAGRPVREQLLTPGGHVCIGSGVAIQYLGPVDFAAEVAAAGLHGAPAAAIALGRGAETGVHLTEPPAAAGLRRTAARAVLAIGHVVECRDPYTAGHERRVAELAAAIAIELGQEGQTSEAVRLAGLIHDIGKISVPAEILAKPGVLSEAEFTLIKQHVRAGYEIVEDIDFGLPIAVMVLQHHERLDGTGYPQGLTRKDILRESMILAVADVTEAMSSHRPYRAALGTEKALSEISAKAGIWYDHDTVTACVRLFNDLGFEFSE